MPLPKPNVSYKCKSDGCATPSAVNCRGLCMKCYKSAKNLVEAGTTTWEDLEELGLADRELTPFEKTFLAKTKEQ